MAKVRLGYGILILIAFLLTLIALFTPGWRSYRGDKAPDFGIVTHWCGGGNRQVEKWDCSRWAKSSLPFEKATVALVSIAAVLQFLAVCCFFSLFSARLRLSMPAVSLCLLAFICLFSAIVIYGVRYDKKIAYMQSLSFELLADVRLGYSYWIAVVATFFTLFATGAAGGLLGNTAHNVNELQ